MHTTDKLTLVVPPCSQLLNKSGPGSMRTEKRKMDRLRQKRDDLAVNRRRRAADRKRRLTMKWDKANEPTTRQSRHGRGWLGTCTTR